MRITLALPALCILATLADSQVPANLRFKKVNLTPKFTGEGVTIGDFNHDGKLDFAAGPLLWNGPDFSAYTKYGDASAAEFYDGSKGWSAYPMNLTAYDFNGDGWLDIPYNAGVGQPDYWMENPKGAAGSWKKHAINNYSGFETNNLYPLLRNGKLQLLYATADKKIGYGTQDPSDPNKPWIFHAIGNPSPTGGFYALNTHGLGIGDINGDGRNDVMTCDAWFEQPASLAGDPLWIRHNFDFSQKKGIASTFTTNQSWGGSQMYADDVDGDGDADIVASLDGHGWGLAWFEQIKDGSGGITFAPHMIMGDRSMESKYGVAFSQPHSLAFADLDGDGLKDIVTGKRYWAHLLDARDPEPMGQAVLYAFMQQRGTGGTTFKPVMIDSAAGAGCRLELTDFNGDGYPDIQVSTKKGTNLFLSEGRAPLPVLPPAPLAGSARAWRLGSGFPVGFPAGGYDVSGAAFRAGERMAPGAYIVKLPAGR